MRLAVTVVTLLAACGRFGFEQTGDDDGAIDAARDATAGGFEPLELLVPSATTTSPVFEDVATLTVPPSPGVRWLLLVDARLESSSLSEVGPEARYLVDGVERGLGGTEALVVGHAGPWQHFYVFTGAATPTVIDFQLRDGLGATTTLHDLRAIAAPLPEGADALFASSDEALQFTAASMTTQHAFTLTPSTAGDYVLLLLVNASESPGGSSIDTQWLQPGTIAPWFKALKNPRAPQQASLLIRAARLGPEPVTLELQGQAASTSTIRYARVLALREEAFPGRLARSVLDLDLETASSTPQLANELTPSLQPGPAYVVLGSMRVDDAGPCGGALAQRGMTFTLDAETQTTEHSAGNCAYETTYGFLRLVDAPPAYVGAAVYSVNGVPTEHEDSGLVVLGFARP